MEETVTEERTACPKLFLLNPKPFNICIKPTCILKIMSQPQKCVDCWDKHVKACQKLKKEKIKHKKNTLALV